MKRKEGDNPMFEQVITYMSNLMQVHMTDQVVLPSLEQLRWPVLNLIRPLACSLLRRWAVMLKVAEQYLPVGGREGLDWCSTGKKDTSVFELDISLSQTAETFAGSAPISQRRRP